MRRLAVFGVIAAAIAVVIRALRRREPGESTGGGEPVTTSTGHASVGTVERQEAEEPPSGPAPETPGTTAPPL